MPGDHGADELLLGFARALRAAGVQVTADRERTYLEAVAEVGLQDQAATYWAGRATLCCSPADLERYDQVYAAWFGDASAPPVRRHDARAGPSRSPTWRRVAAPGASRARMRTSSEPWPARPRCCGTATSPS